MGKREKGEAPRRGKKSEGNLRGDKERKKEMCGVFWNRSKEKKYTENKNFWFLTCYGTLVESYLDEGFPRDPLSIFGLVLKTIRKQLKKDLKKPFFLVLKFLNERFRKSNTILFNQFLNLEAKFAMFDGIRGVLMRDSVIWWWT
ncbi:hypothetical protein MTR_3g101440 [Medicago truncatula]|uniref:Uncharacterized protein n=1 Tax=Medicago truncatula TaxID=3880 RepID=G7J6B2_MEDTR|nr:hypothetical protein MTR_3g101440 [Medicago truncatula]